MELMRDYRGLLLCTNCWDGKHNYAKGKGVIMNCAGGKCECPCAQLAANYLKRRVKLKAEQAVIDTGADVIDVKANS